MAASGSGQSILVDARALGDSGIGRYLGEVLRELLRDSHFSVIMLLGDPAVLSVFVRENGAEGKVRIQSFAYGFYSPRAQLAWLRLRARGSVRADVSFFPHYDAPYFALPPRSVVTVQDLTHFKVPEVFPAWKRTPAGLLLDRVVRRAHRVIVTSESTRRDLLERQPGVAEKIVKIPLGVGEFFLASRCEEGNDPVVDKLRPFLLCVGNRKPHKNLVAAVEALALLRKAQPSLRLVIVGRRFPGCMVRERAAALGIGEAVVELDDVDDRRLRCLYSRCEVFLFPSLYEGFGLPVLEAMACGAPVVASNRASIPEVVGDAGVLVDPTDYTAIAATVRSVINDTQLRHELVARGRLRAEQYTWGRTAGRTADLLCQVADGVMPLIA